MGRTIRHNSDYGYKQDYRDRTNRQVKKLTKKVQKITKQKIVIQQPNQKGEPI
jgi:hypothetical protein